MARAKKDAIAASCEKEEPELVAAALMVSTLSFGKFSPSNNEYEVVSFCAEKFPNKFSVWKPQLWA